MRKLCLSLTTVEANIHTFELADSMPIAALPTTAVTLPRASPADVLVAAGNASWRYRHRSSPERRADRCHPAPALVA